MSKRNERNQKNSKARRKLMAKYLDGGGTSKYAMKKRYCDKNGVWGFEVPAPKPWQRKIG
jgi:hypothetical protein